MSLTWSKLSQQLQRPLPSNLDIERVSIGNFSDDGESFCAKPFCILKSSNKHTKRRKDRSIQYPIYFKALSENLSIVADDVAKTHSSPNFLSLF